MTWVSDQLLFFPPRLSGYPSSICWESSGPPRTLSRAFVENQSTETEWVSFQAPCGATGLPACPHDLDHWALQKVLRSESRVLPALVFPKIVWVIPDLLHFQILNRLLGLYPKSLLKLWSRWHSSGDQLEENWYVANQYRVSQFMNPVQPSLWRSLAHSLLNLLLSVLIFPLFIDCT